VNFCLPGAAASPAMKTSAAMGRQEIEGFITGFAKRSRRRIAGLGAGGA
jgi:hypothetical protein